MTLPDFWRRRTPLTYALLPAAWLFGALVGLRRMAYRCGLLPRYRAPVPVIVVGNLTVGGNGKTPLVIALAQKFTAAGWRVGIVSRGYGGQARTVLPVRAGDNPQIVGDEPLLMAQKTALPVFIGRQRAKAVAQLLRAHPTTNLIISDDGLQHYALARDIEIVVIAPDLGFGNGFLLPAGALRESPRRLARATFTVSSDKKYGQYRLRAEQTGLFPLQGEGLFPELHGRPVYAFSTIARPERFFATVRQMGWTLAATHFLPDHAAIAPADVAFARDGVLFVTEKDAVKMAHFPSQWRSNIWVVRYDYRIPADLWQALQAKLSPFRRQDEAQNNGE